MSKNIYCGRGFDVPYADYMDLINLSFGFHTPERQFLGLLPKLYREEYRPQDSNYVVIEDGVLTTAVGAYDHELIVCGHRLPCRGIGNVAVHPDHRSKGYMKDAMNASLKDMVADGIALSTLGGRRQRYQYFGYDKAGPIYHFHISRDNLRHTYKDLSSPFEVRLVTDAADPVIDDILTLVNAQPVIPVRLREHFLDIANTWRAKLLVFADGERFVGYAILDESKSISEILTVDSKDFMNVIRSVFAYLNEGFSVCLSFHAVDAIQDLAPLAEGMSVGCAMHFNILNYRAVTEAFLDLKLSYTKLPDGAVTFLIHGFAGDEKLTVRVSDGAASVTEAAETDPVDYELSHMEAMAFLYSPISPLRDGSSDLCKLWFPLPVCMYRADEV